MAIKKKNTRKATTGTVELIVRRGALRRFDKLKQATATLPVKVLWDRRGATQDAAPARPPRERRQDPPFTWDAADFVVVEPESEQRPKKTKTQR